jgi:hypothetical protein
MVTSKHIHINVTLSQLIEEHFFCSLKSIEVYVLASIECVTKNEHSINVLFIKSGKEDVVIKLLKEIYERNAIIPSTKMLVSNYRYSH